jgi:hypothetical protein
MLAAFKLWIDQNHGSAKALFEKLDGNGNNKLSLSEFRQGVQKYGLPEDLLQSMDVLFWVLNMGEIENKLAGMNITPDGMIFLDRWKVPPYLWGEADPELASETQEKMVAHFGGNAIVAWRSALDQNVSMRISWGEFTHAFYRLEREGVKLPTSKEQLVSIYLTYDTKKKGYFLLCEWNKEAHDELVRFSMWAGRTYSQPSRFVTREEGGQKPGLSLSEFSHLIRGCDDWALEDEEIKYLFRGLANGAGRLCSYHLMFLDKWNFAAPRASGVHFMSRGGDKSEPLLPKEDRHYLSSKHSK